MHPTIQEFAKRIEDDGFPFQDLYKKFREKFDDRDPKIVVLDTISDLFEYSYL